MALPPGGRRHVKGSHFAGRAAVPAVGVLHATDVSDVQHAAGRVRRPDPRLHGHAGCCRPPGWRGCGITAARTTSSRAAAGTRTRSGWRCWTSWSRCSSRPARRSASRSTTPSSAARARKVWGAHYLHDGAQPEGSGRRTRWGNCWVVVVLVVELPCLGGRQVALPVLFRLFRPKDDQHPDRPSQPELATHADRHGHQALSLAGRSNW